MSSTSEEQLLSIETFALPSILPVDPLADDGPDALSQASKTASEWQAWVAPLDAAANALRHKDWATALSILRAQVVSEQTSPVAHLLYAFAQNRNGNIEEARAHLQTARRQNPFLLHPGHTNLQPSSVENIVGPIENLRRRETIWSVNVAIFDVDLKPIAAEPKLLGQSRRRAFLRMLSVGPAVLFPVGNWRGSWVEYIAVAPSSGTSNSKVVLVQKSRGELSTYVGSNRSLVCLTIEDGHILWQRKLSRRQHVVLTSAASVCIGDGASIICFDIADGSQRWTITASTFQMAFWGGTDDIAWHDGFKQLNRRVEKPTQPLSRERMAQLNAIQKVDDWRPGDKSDVRVAVGDPLGESKAVIAVRTQSAVETFRSSTNERGGAEMGQRVVFGSLVYRVQLSDPTLFKAPRTRSTRAASGTTRDTAALSQRLPLGSPINGPRPMRPCGCISPFGRRSNSASRST